MNRAEFHVTIVMLTLGDMLTSSPCAVPTKRDTIIAGVRTFQAAIRAGCRRQVPQERVSPLGTLSRRMTPPRQATGVALTNMNVYIVRSTNQGLTWSTPQFQGVKAGPVPDTIAVMSTVSPDNVVHIASSSSTQLFAIGTSNVGATGTIVVSADAGGLPLTLTVCETTGGSFCLALPTPTVTVNYLAGTNRSFAFFAQALGSIPFDPANNRIFARLKEAGVLRGATSTAVCTKPNAGC
jgi:hypothetical protein